MNKKNYSEGKRKLALVLCFALLFMFSLSACGGSEESADSSDSQTASEETADQSSDQTADQSSSDASGTEEQESIDLSTLAGEGGVDVDLTKLSSTMVYSVVFDMLTRASEYMGKKVRMIGLMSSYYDEEKDTTYYACIVQDATACCSQGIEFEVSDEMKESLPEDNSIITVVGTYDLYEDDGYNYAILRDAVLEK